MAHLSGGQSRRNSAASFCEASWNMRASIAAASRLFAAVMAWMSPVQCRFSFSIGIACGCTSSHVGPEQLANKPEPCQQNARPYSAYLSIATSCSATLDPEGGPLRRLPDAGDDALAQVRSERLPQAHCRRRLALAKWRWADARNHHCRSSRAPSCSSSGYACMHAITFSLYHPHAPYEPLGPPLRFSKAESLTCTSAVIISHRKHRGRRKQMLE